LLKKRKQAKEKEQAERVRELIREQSAKRSR
jgi:hypothetical protein